MKYSYMVVSNDIKGEIVTGIRGDYEKVFKVIKNSGYDGVELMIKNPDNVDFDHIKSLLKKFNLELPVICTGEFYGEDGLSFGNPDKEIRKEAIERTIKTMRIARDFNASVNVGRLRGRFLDGIKRVDTINWSKEGFIKSAEAVKETNLLLEPINHKVSNFILNNDEGVDFVESINLPNVRMMIDYAHMVIEKENFKESIFLAKDYIDHVHVCEADRSSIGLSDSEFKEFADALKNVGYDKYISVEAFDSKDYESYLKRGREILQEYFD